MSGSTQGTDTVSFTGVDTVDPAGTKLTFSGDALLGSTTIDANGAFNFSTTVPASQGLPDVFYISGSAGGIIGDLIPIGPNETGDIRNVNGTYFLVSEATTGQVSASDTGDQTSATVTPGQTVTPFEYLALSDTIPTETISATITTAPGYSTSGATNPTTFTGTVQQVQNALDSFTATSTGSAGAITATVDDSTGQPVGSFTFTGNPVGVVSVSDASDPTTAPVTKNETVTPFAHLNISDTLPSETISATISVTGSGYASSGTTITGTASQVQTAVDKFSDTAVSSGPGAITVTVVGPTSTSGSQSSGTGGGKVPVPSSFTFTGTKPGGSGLATPTNAQITTLTNDTISFYNDDKNQLSTASDASKMASDLTGLSISKNQLGTFLTTALQADLQAAPGGSAAGTALGTDLAGVFYGTINNDLQSQSGSLTGDLTTMMNQAVAVGGTYAALSQGELPSLALSQTVAQYKLTG